MFYKRFLLLAALCIPSVIAVKALANQLGDNRTTQNKIVYEELLSSSDDEIAQSAITYARENGMVRENKIEIALNIPATTDYLLSVGLSTTSFAGEAPPLQLVVFKGDFDLSGLPGSAPRAVESFDYMAYIMDLNAGVPTTIIGSPNGALFKQALNDPTLPESEMIPGALDGLRSTSEAIPSPPLPSPPDVLPYGTLVPGTPENLLQVPDLPEAPE